MVIACYGGGDYIIVAAEVDRRTRVCLFNNDIGEVPKH